MFRRATLLDRRLRGACRLPAGAARRPRPAGDCARVSARLSPGLASRNRQRHQRGNARRPPRGADGDGPCESQARDDRCRYRRGRGLLHRAPRRAGRCERAACSRRTSTRRRSSGSAAGSSASGSTMSRSSSAREDDPRAARKQLRPHLHGPHVSRGDRALRASSGGLRPALSEGGQVIVVDVDRPTDEHGIRPAPAVLRIFGMWAFAWSNLFVSPNWLAITRNSKRWARARATRD